MSAARNSSLKRLTTAGAAVALLYSAGALFAQRPEQSPQALLQTARSDFRAGRVPQSVTGFDRVRELAPQAAPELWDRGIALYYVDRFRDCRAQFDDIAWVSLRWTIR